MSIQRTSHSGIHASGLFVLCALALSGCFNNLSGLGSSRVSAQSNGAQLNDSGFAGETGTIDTEAVLIGTYNNAGGSGYGILVDLQKSLTATLGATNLQTVLSVIDSNTAMQSRPVVVHFSSFGIKAATTLGKLAAGNGGKLRNIMNIRPGLVRVDLTTSALEIPATPSVTQLGNSNKTVITYGGRIEGDYVRRMTVLIPFAGVNASFLPSTANATYGDGYPAATPDELSNSVRLFRLGVSGTGTLQNGTTTSLNGTEIATRFGAIITNPPYGQTLYNSIQSDAIKAVVQTKDSLALAVHLGMDANGGVPVCQVSANPATGCNADGSRKIIAAYLININPANTSGPETFPLCHSGYDAQDQTATYNDSGFVDFSHPLACNCPPGVPNGCVATYHNGQPNGTQFIDPVPPNTTAGIALRWPQLLARAMAVAAANSAPAYGTIPISSPLTVGDFVLSQPAY